MRKILFRGRIKDTREWVFGYVELDGVNEAFYIYGFEVEPETIGQFTGLTDDNDNKIFEGDIVKCFSSDYVGNPKINTITVKDMIDYNTMVYLNCSDRLVIIGNIYDNPELLGDK